MDNTYRLGLLEPLQQPVEFIPDSGGSLVSLSVLDGSPLKWAFREPSVNPQDNGWRFLAASDSGSDEVEPDSLRVRTFNTVANFEPLALQLWGAPVGTDVQLVVDADGRKSWYDNSTGQLADLPYTEDNT